MQLKKGEKLLKLGIIVTPDCDLEQGSTKYVELIELKEMEDPMLGLNTGMKTKIAQFNHPSYYFFPAMRFTDSGSFDFVAVYKSKMIIEGSVETGGTRYPGVSNKLTYSDEFSYNGQVIQMIHICSKSDPYKSDFLHNVHAHDSRVGTPDIRKLLND